MQEEWRFFPFFNNENKLVRDVRADVVEENSFLKYLKNNKVLFFGDGSIKCVDVIKSENAYFERNIFPQARDMH